MIAAILSSERKFGRHLPKPQLRQQVIKGVPITSVAVGLGGSQQIIQFSGSARLLAGSVHFPVTCYDVFSH
jgi:hypothetical protein